MTQDIAYPQGTKTHVALAVKDVEAALPFYRALLGIEPAKVHPGYVKFDAAQPPLSLALNQSPSARGARLPAHFGIQVQDSAVVQAMAERLRQAGLKTVEEEGVTCCYALQDKVWASDPDGNEWEVYTVLEDTLDAAEATLTQGDSQEACCAPECCS